MLINVAHVSRIVYSGFDLYEYDMISGIEITYHLIYIQK